MVRVAAKEIAAIVRKDLLRFRQRLRQAMLMSNIIDYFSNSFSEKMLLGIFASNDASSILISVE